MEDYKLKRCPFCGGKAELIIVPGYFKTGLSSTGWLVKCLNGCVNQMPHMSDHDAVEAWNRRVPMVTLDDSGIASRVDDLVEDFFRYYAEKYGEG